SGSDGAGSTVAEIEVDLGDDIEICSSSGYELNADSPFADSYEWYQNGIYIEGINSSTLVVTESDSYTVIAYDEQCDSFAQDSVFVNFYTPVANSPGQMIVCDDLSMDGIEIFNLASLDETLLGDQDISTYVVSYYISEEDALNGGNPINISFENTSNPQTIYARVENPSAEGCFDTTSFDLVVQGLPTATFNNSIDYEVCPNATIPVEINIITELAAESYEVSWIYNGNNLENENSLVLGVLNAGNYEFTLTSNDTGCSYSDNIDVIELESCVIPKGISPNDDGYNDDFDLSSYNVSSLKVFNRYGELVYSKKNYTNEWRGQSSNGKLLPVSTYFYVMRYDEDKIKTDWVYLNY
ncbi:MAG: gliding motility-associated C-terminal domain-containing protein, partial [Flavobacteriales bacterium]